MTWERKTWLEEYDAEERISDISARYQISRKTLYKWVQRYEAYGLEGLQELSRAPHEHPQAVNAVWRERILAVRQEHPSWGAGKLWRVLEQRYREGMPSASTIGRVLRESGLSHKRGRRARAHGTGSLYEGQEPNEVWAVDFKGWCRTGDGRHCEPLTMSDYATRYLLCCQGLESTRTELVRPVMEQVFRQYGIPERIRSDNGAPFASQGECGLTELAVWWMELGMEWERIEPGHPQQNGRHERLHRTLKEATMQPPARTWRQQQRRFESFVKEYNEQRPHEALEQQFPVALYRCSRRQYPAVIAEPEYGRGWLMRKIHAGQVCCRSRRFFLSHALNDKLVGLEPLEDGLWKVWFYRHWLGVWHEKIGRLYQPQQWKREQARQRAEQSPPEQHDDVTAAE